MPAQPASRGALLTPTDEPATAVYGASTRSIRSQAVPHRASLLLAVIVAADCTPCCPDEVPSFSEDPEGVHQWHMPTLGVPEAWHVQRGNPEVTVAVIDNGFDLEHPDLAGQHWTNGDELPNGLDDDGNGYIDDLHGWDFLDDDADAGLERDPDLDAALLSHGTAVAGIIAARTDNGAGVAGCCPGCQLMLLRGRDFVEAHNVMPVLAEAIRYAVRNGARVINISDGVLDGWLEPEMVTEIEAALEEADEAGLVVVASAGNDGGEIVRWPGSMDAVVAVASVDAQMRPSAWTSFGAEVDVAAPGECIYSTAPQGGYGYFEGTSAAAPIVSGLAALLFTAHPTWSAAEVVEQILSTTRPALFDTRPEAEGELGTGVVDFNAAISE